MNQYINPFDLLSVNPHEPDLKILRKNYKHLALICHPDKGGSSASMIRLHKAYIYIKYQFEHCNKVKSYEELEDEFTEFCRRQKSKIPKLQSILLEKDPKKRSVKFNTEYELNKTSSNQESYIHSFNSGYGFAMAKSEYAKGKLSYDNNNIKEPSHFIFDNVVQKNELSIYQEPKTLQQTYGNYQRYDVSKITDFSSNEGELYMCDYKQAFRILGKDNIDAIPVKKRTLKGIMRERERL